MKLAIGALLLLVSVAFAQTQKDGVAKSKDGAAQALIELENRWVDALVKSDMAALDAIFDDTYVDTDEHSHRSNKEDVLSALKSGNLKIDSIKLAGLQVHVYGDAAVVIGSSEQAGNFLGGPLAAKIIFTDTFIKQTGKWRAVASHRSAE